MLAGCSMHTRYTIELDVASFINPPARGQLALPFKASFTLFLPDEDGNPLTPDPDGIVIHSVLPSDRYLIRASLDLAIAVKEIGGAPLEFTVEVYVAPPDANDLYHGEGTRIGKGELRLEPSAQGTFFLALELVSGNPGFDLISDESFRLGIKLAGSAKGFKYELTTLNLALTTRPVGEILNP